MHKKQITRLYKGEKYLGWGGRYYTRKCLKNKEFSYFIMRSGRARTQIRKFENRRWRRNKMSVDNWKKYGIAYIWSIY